MKKQQQQQKMKKKKEEKEMEASNSIISYASLVCFQLFYMLLLPFLFVSGFQIEIDQWWHWHSGWAIIFFF